MQHIQGYNRDQLTLLPEALDDYIAQDNPVRFLDAFVDALDVERLGFQHAVLKETGRPPYHPADLLKLYLYGYLNRTRSSRQLEREAGRNLELLWLLRRYYATSACTSCSLKARCTRSKKGRRISRRESEDVLEAMEARVQAHPEKVKLRKTIAEHPFGTLKHHWDQAYFLTKGLENVGTEMSLSVLAYNLKRTIQILGLPRMIEALA